MTILVTGSTGTIGSEVVRQLVARNADVRALARKPEEAKLPDGVAVVQGDMTDIASMRAALKGIDTLFVINAVVPDELTQALTTFDLAREAGIKRFVYFSVLMGDRFTDVPHFAGKYTVERMIETEDLSASILRAAYFTQNDLNLKPALLAGLYPQPIGGIGVAMADIRDIAEVAALELIRRDEAAELLPRETMLIGGPDALTGAGIAEIWTQALGREIRYAGDDLAAFEQMFSKFAPAWMAYDMRMMMRGFQRHGMLTTADANEKLERLLGRPLRSYRDFAGDAAAQWRQG